MTIINMPLQCTQAIVLRRCVNWRLAMLLAATGSAAAVLGVSVLATHDDVGMKRLLGVVLLLLFMWRAALESHLQKVLAPPEPFDVRRAQNFAMVLIAGLV